MALRYNVRQMNTVVLRCTEMVTAPANPPRASRPPFARFIADVVPWVGCSGWYKVKPTE